MLHHGQFHLQYTHSYTFFLVAVTVVHTCLILVGDKPVCVGLKGDVTSCYVQVDSHGVVSVKPDFNQDKPAHRVENRHRGMC